MASAAKSKSKKNVSKGPTKGFKKKGKKETYQGSRRVRRLESLLLSLVATVVGLLSLSLDVSKWS